MLGIFIASYLSNSIVLHTLHIMLRNSHDEVCCAAMTLCQQTQHAFVTGPHDLGDSAVLLMVEAGLIYTNQTTSCKPHESWHWSLPVWVAIVACHGPHHLASQIGLYDAASHTAHPSSCAT